MDKEAFSQELFGDKPEKRKVWHDILADPIWVPQYNIPLKQMREDCLKRLQFVASKKVVSVMDFGRDPTNIFTAHEMIA